MPISEVYNIDCMKYMKGLPDKYFDLAIADPPFGGAGNDTSGSNEIRNNRGRFERYKAVDCERTGGTWASKYGKNIKDWDNAPSQEFFDELMRVSNDQIIFGGNYFSLPPTRCFVVWRKLTISESFTMAMAEYAWTSFNQNAKVFEFAPQGKKGDERFHPTQKPVELYGWLLSVFKPIGGGKIFDPMIGSQSSRIACYKAGIDFYGCEINEEYFRKGNERFERECLGIETLPNGKKVIQQSLF